MFIFLEVCMKLFFLLFPVLAFCVPFNDPIRDPAPYLITGDGFRVHCDFVFDEVDRSLNPKSVTPKSTVFVNGDYIAEYFQKIHPYIECDYILVTHNSDASMPGDFRPFLDDEKIIAWFTANIEGDPSPKLHPLPLGIANRTLPFGNVDMIKKVKEARPAKEHLLYFNLTIQNYLPERWAVYQIFKQAPFCYRPIKKRFEHYAMDVMSSQFILSPRGVGPDTYRLWESLYLDSYPVTKSSALDPLFKNLPVVVVKDWKDVTESFLNQQYEIMKKTQYDKKKLDIAYWINMIDSFKKS